MSLKSIRSDTVNNNRQQLPKEQRAFAHYSSLRSTILSLTPGDKCRFYCSGSACKYCHPLDSNSEEAAIDGLYSTWITDNILAMARPMMRHFTERDLILSFQKNKISSVINLQVPGEHAFCGDGILESTGFSYDPELLMKNNISHYNFPLPDFEACSASHLLDIVKVVNNALKDGNVAVHCHAGKGRTGMVIAATLVYSNGLTPLQAVSRVREKRPHSVQCTEQVKALHQLKLLLCNGQGLIIPKEKLASIYEYLEYNKYFMNRAEARLYGHIPKVVYLTMLAILRVFYERIEIDLMKLDTGYLVFNCSCYRGTGEGNFDEAELEATLVGADMASIAEWYANMVAQGMTISSYEYFLEHVTDFRQLIKFLDFFFHTSFHQLYKREELLNELKIDKNSGYKGNGQLAKDYNWCFFFLLECCSKLPRELHHLLARLISRWFTRVEGDLPRQIVDWMQAAKER